jgi:hypothetical protein
MFTIQYNHKPSKPTIIACVRKALNNKSDYIIIIWGENQITIEKTIYGLIGSGWIGKNSGQDIAQLFKMQ